MDNQMFSLSYDHDRILQYFAGSSTISKKYFKLFTFKKLGSWMVPR